ncbi:MFS transporter [Betaproteobacteria bacterium PRO7]|nr:MFS transporter [Betaproteobacteria bacterium PRO7]
MTTLRAFSLRLRAPETGAGASPLLFARGLRAIGDGYLAVLLPVYLLALGLDTLQIGVIATATLLGSALSTIAIGVWGHRWSSRGLLQAAGLLMAATGVGFAGCTSFWPLLGVAFIGTLNPSAGDVSVFLPLEHARLAGVARGEARTALFARYSTIGALCAALGALAAGLPDWLVQHAQAARLDALRGMFLAYAAIGLVVWAIYRATPADRPVADEAMRAAPLTASRRIVVRLAALFSVDAFAGGLIINALMSLWLLQRFGLSLAQAGAFFFWTGLLSAASQFAAPRVARRFGLLNTMVFTHIPSSVCLIVAALVPSLPAALALLLVRSALSQMDVPTRSAYVMSVVTPPERAAAASFTAVPRSLAASLSPSIAGALLAAGWLALPLVACGVLKIAYDLTLWHACRNEPLNDP